MSDQDLKDIIQGILNGTDAEDNDFVVDALVALIKLYARNAGPGASKLETDKQWQATTA